MILLRIILLLWSWWRQSRGNAVICLAKAYLVVVLFHVVHRLREDANDKLALLIRIESRRNYQVVTRRQLKPGAHLARVNEMR